jgi:hypothetical protein
MKFFQFAKDIELTEEEQQWWDALEPHFRRRFLLGAGVKATLGAAALFSYQWFSGDKDMELGYVLSMASLIYAAFGLHAIKADLPMKRDQLIRARRLEQAVLAEPDEVPELPPRSATARRFK